MKQTLKIVDVVLSLILPIVMAISLMDLDVLNPYFVLWCGFYGSLLTIFFSKSNLLKVSMGTVNIGIILFMGFVSLMGGAQGLTSTLLNMLIPFYPLLVR